MDVRIAYGISLDEVPDKIAAMVADIDIAEIDQILDIVSRLITLSDENISTSIDLLDQARLKLSSIDRAMGDCQMMLKGYENTKNPVEAEANEEPVDVG